MNIFQNVYDRKRRLKKPIRTSKMELSKMELFAKIIKRF